MILRGGFDKTSIKIFDLLTLSKFIPSLPLRGTRMRDVRQFFLVRDLAHPPQAFRNFLRFQIGTPTYRFRFLLFGGTFLPRVFIEVMKPLL